MCGLILIKYNNKNINRTNKFIYFVKKKYYIYQIKIKWDFKNL